MKRIASLFLALVLAFSLCACAAPAEKADDGKLQIVTTLFPYYDFARAIVGDRADVTLLLSPGREAHSFEPTPLDAVTISESDVFLYNCLLYTSVQSFSKKRDAVFNCVPLF